MMPGKLFRLSLSFCAALGLSAVATNAQTVTKLVDNFEQAGAWASDSYNTGSGEMGMSPDVPVGIASKQSLKLTARFTGTGFQNYSVDPVAPLLIPGDAKEITIHYKLTADERYTITMAFVDGYGRSRDPGKGYFIWKFGTKTPGQWETATYKVPAGLVMPLQIASIGVENWEAKQVKQDVSLFVDNLEVTTDITNVDRKTGLLSTWKPQESPANPDAAPKQPPTTPLIDVQLSTGQPGNLFEGQDPRLLLQVRNWLPDPLKGNLTLSVTDDAGQAVDKQEKPFEAEASLAMSVPLKVARFGRYKLSAHAALQGTEARDTSMFFAKLPSQPELTAEQKIASPYGLNVHSGGPWPLAAYRAAGLVWYREYAFTWDWLERAKGTNNDFAGWPYFPKIVQNYLDHGAMVAPVLQKSIVKPEFNADGSIKKIGPDPQWVRMLVQVVSAFPDVKFWELSNEYDLPAANSRAEDRVGWKNYGLYHKKFGAVLDLLGGGSLFAISNGTAGIHPSLTEKLIKEGYFDQIDALSFHHYCGIEPPETNIGNNNTASGEVNNEPPTLFVDQLRQMKKVGNVDGHQRQAWLTEVGWDTLAGKVVTPYQQAVYLPRMWMMAMAAGTDKVFWFYDKDAANPSHFFDGCGLLDANLQPKASICSLAAMTSLLPTPQYVGSINAGPDTQGYVFQEDGKLIASLWSISKDDGPKASFKAERLLDFMGNPVQGNDVQLTMAPLYAVGIDRGGDWYKQTAYDIQSPYMENAAAGDPLKTTVTIHNNRSEPIVGKVSLQLPDGWKTDAGEQSYTVAPGKTAEVTLPFSVSFNESLGLKQATIRFAENGKTVKEMPLVVLVSRPFMMHVSPIVTAPDEPTTVKVTLVNLSTRPQSGKLELKLPVSWKAITPTIEVSPLQPREQRVIDTKLAWNDQWKTGESASVVFVTSDGEMSQPLIPPSFHIPEVQNVKIDGDLSDWPADSQFPQWMLGSTDGKPNAEIHMAWSPKGLLVGVNVHDSQVVVKNPKEFWDGDTLELFINNQADQKKHSFGKGDHQFWFVPLVKEHRAYVGQWKQGDELPATLYDIQGIESSVVARDGGYVMEFLLPSERFGFHPQANGKITLNLNLTVHGGKSEREVYWTRAKSDGVTTHPGEWGTIRLMGGK